MSTLSPGFAAAGGALIGLAAVLLMVTTGRIAGVSGFVSRLLPPYGDQQTITRLAFVVGLLLAPALYRLASGEAVNIVVTSNVPLLLAAGFLVGFGSVFGGSSTSGHDVCGTARLSKRSLIATSMFMVVAIATVFVTRHALGGQ